MPVRIEEQQTLQAGAEGFSSLTIRLARTLAFLRERIEQRFAFLFRAVQDHTAFRAGEHVPASIICRYSASLSEDILGIEFNGESTARFAFGTMGLIDRPVANRRQQTTVGSHVAKQQAMIGNQDIRSFGTLARPMDEAQVTEERALAAQTFLAARRDHLSRQQTIIKLQAVDIVIFRLLDKRKQRRHSRGLRQLFALNLLHRSAVIHHAANLAKTRIVGEALQRRTRQRLCVGIGCAQRLRKSGNLFEYQLIKQSIRFGCHTDGNAVPLRGKRQRNQIRHGFTDAGSSFNHKIVPRSECITYRSAHISLLGARLIILVQVAHKTLLAEGLGNLLGSGVLHTAHRIGGNRIRINLRPVFNLAKAIATNGLQREQIQLTRCPRELPLVCFT